MQTRDSESSPSPALCYMELRKLCTLYARSLSAFDIIQYEIYGIVDSEYAAVKAQIVA